MDDDDERVKYLHRQVLHAYRHIPVEKLNDYWTSDYNRRILSEFLESADIQALFVREAKNSIEISDLPIRNPKGLSFYFAKLVKGPVSHDRLFQEIIYGDVSVDPLEHLLNLSKRIYNPIVDCKESGVSWSDAIAKDVRENFDNFVANIQITQGNVEGVTCLPLPNSYDQGMAKEVDSTDQSSTGQQQEIHALEGAIITWTKQIKNILKQDPEGVLVKLNNPGPLMEIEFWRSKSVNLNGIFDQLQSDKVRRILKVLDKSKSTYNAPFAKLCKEVFHARAEANNIVKYLRPLTGYFNKLEDDSFEQLEQHFRPIMHLILLVWKTSAYYNTPSRLVVIMREVCNTIIRQAGVYLNGDTMFELIDAGNAAEVVKMLQMALRVFGKFKSTYFDYKSKATTECPDNPWRVQNNALFIRLDAFLERCHDVLDLAQTIVQFTKLAKIEIGGTKGKTLTTSVAQIYFDFTQAVEQIRAVGHGILDLDNKDFDDAFYEFRTRMKELDRRLGCVIVQGFDDAMTVAGQFRLLDTFDNLITRIIIADELEKKHFALIAAIRVDVEEVQKIFLGNKDLPLVGNNLPPIAGALTWCRGLLERVQSPMDKLRIIDRKVLERDDARDVVKIYTILLGQLADFERERIEVWGRGIEASSQSKLKNPLLRRVVLEETATNTNGAIQELHVNFDPILVQLLREVKYFLLLGLQVPETAMEVYQKSEVFRRHTGNLDLIVNMYNNIQSSLLPVERPLVKSQLEKIDKTLLQGIGDLKTKTKALNWKSTGIDLFISEAMTEAKEVTDVLQVLKGNLKRVEEIVEVWAVHPVFERMSRTVSLDDFNLLQIKIRQTRIQAIKESGHEIHRLLKDTNKRLKVSQGLPDWKAYVDFVNNIVVIGLTDAMTASLRSLSAHLNPKLIDNDRNVIQPLFEIQLDLIENEVHFIPEVGSEKTPGKFGVMNYVDSWINGMLGLSSCFKRLDTGEGTYIHELVEGPEVLLQKARVAHTLCLTADNANTLRKMYKKYEYLWKTELQQLFAEFLKKAVILENISFAMPDRASMSGEIQPIIPDAVDLKAKIGTWIRTTINLDLFAEKIQSFLEVQTEVSDLKAAYEVDFMRINAQPIKQAISTLVTKWLYMHTQYLLNHVSSKLNEFYTFHRDMNKGLDKMNESVDRETLMSILSHIRDVRKRMPEISALFDPLRNIVMLLKKQSIQIDLPPIGGQSALDFLEAAKMLWDNTVNRAFRVKEDIQPVQNSMVDSIRKEIKHFDNHAAKFVKEFRTNGPFSYIDTTHRGKDTAHTIIDKYWGQHSGMTEKASSLNELEELFELPLSTHDLLTEMGSDLRLLKHVWDILLLVESLFSQWKNTLWADIKTEDLLDEVKSLQFQIHQINKKAREWGLYTHLEMYVMNMATVLPLVHELHSPSLRDRHWKTLMATTGTTFEKGASFCLDDLLALNLHRYVEAVMEIVEVANKELKIETRLQTIQDIWKKLELKFDRHRDSDTLVVSPPDDVLDALEEHHLQLQAMAGMGKFVEFFRDAVTLWQSTLGNVETTLKLILLVEREWGSLESIFLGSQDIRSQLPEDTKRFEGVDTEFKELMRDLFSNPNVVSCCATDGREHMLQSMHKELEKCEKALNEYLEVKKGIFPRFYFVSNAALLDILSNGNNPPKIMAHIGSVFDGVGDLELCLSPVQQKLMKEDRESGVGPPQAARAMISKDKEKVNFPFIFEMRGAVEFWLNELLRCMHETMRHVLVESTAEAALWDLEKPREDWIFFFPAQLALVTSQIVWTEEVERALEEREGGSEDSVKNYCNVCTARLEGLIRLVQGELSKGDRVKIITVITVDVHNRDVVTSLVQKRVESNVDFKWQSQLRYYWSPDDRNVTIRICDYNTMYSYEYAGNCGRLVITPLTDRCYVTLTVALRLNLGGAPAGPAGTGKTETTKDLARGLGLSCYVFNCSDQMNYQTMADIFKGLAQVGAWGCFDEFNRIDIEVLSVVASQVRFILDAIQHLGVVMNRPKDYQNLPPGAPPMKVGTFKFFGENISLVPTVGLFITMNPGYAGRTELPENLKALFRSCAMIRPDMEPIAENMLMAEGFVKARPLSIKFITLYRLLSELLSKQNHYDWGLRAVKSVLSVAGILKRADPKLEEEMILMRALRDFNTPKIPNNDIPIFMRLIADLFPGLDLPPKVNETLHKTCVEYCKTQNLQPEELFVIKVLQYQEILDVRHSVMLLGPAGCGKTVIWKTLAGCHNHLKNKPMTIFETVNPKSVTTDELYGYMTLTKDWRDGVLSIIMRNMSKNISPYSVHQTGKWIVLDGDIDAGWIESMNSVMDDNKVLTLVSNERIPLNDSMRMVFEVSSLKNATPATVSRAGILYINDVDIGYIPFVESWLAARNSEIEKSSLPDLFDKYLSRMVDILHTQKLEFVVPLPIINVVQNLCFLLEGMLSNLTSERTPAAIERIFLFAAMWAFGGALGVDKQADPRRTFSSHFKSITKNIKFPEGANVFDYFIESSTGDVVPWRERLAQAPASSHDGYANLMVPTADTITMSYLLDLLVRNNRPVMLVGSAGTGKTMIVNDFLATLTADDGYKSSMINMNYYTDSLALQQQLEQCIEKRSGKTYGPPASKLVFFVDDLNLPRVEEYGTQTPIALLRQHIDHGCWYDRSDMGLKKQIVDSQYIACMNHKSGSFFVDPRLQRHFVTFACQMPSDTDLNTIFGTILSNHLYNFDSRVQKHAKAIMNATIVLHKEMTQKFLPSAIKFHYNFTMRDLAAIVKGLLNSRPKEHTTPVQLSRLWYHEVMRVFSDRLVSESEVARCHNIIGVVCKKFFDEDPEGCCAEPCTFVHFIGGKGDHADHLGNYISCDDSVRLKKELERRLHSYNDNFAIMNLVLFDQAIRHVTRITRILMIPGGHALLVGLGGSGKQSLSKLAAFICRYVINQLTITTDFTMNDFKECLKDIYKRTGTKPGLPLMFLITDIQVTDERFFVYINDLLNSGRIPDLYTKDEYDTILTSLRSQAKLEGIPDNRESMLNYFINKVRANLHVVLCFSPVGETFRQRARKFPGIVNCTSIDWFHEWPKDALVSVAQRKLDDVNINPPEVRDNIAYHIAEVHASVNLASTEFMTSEKRYNYTTPKTFLDLIEFYKSLLKARRDEMSLNMKRLYTGLDTLQRTNKDVGRLQEFLKEKKKEVELKKASTDELLEEMGRQRAEAETQQELADVEKRKADAAAEEARKLEQQAAGDLAKAKPALDKAVEAVNCLDKNSMTELKTFSKPPPGVDKVTTALLIMIKGEKKDFSWDNAKKMMAKVDVFKEKLETYRGEDIPEDVIARVQPFLEHPDFNFERMKTKSAAAANLCNWVVNIIEFHNIYKNVKPLMDSLEVATQKKQSAEDDLAVVEKQLQVIDAKLNKLQAAFMAATQDKTKVEREAKDCIDRLSLAERLTTGLSSEKERWQLTVEGLHEREVTLPGDVMLAAAFTSYIGAFGATFRNRLWRDSWVADLLAKEIPLTQSVDPLWVLTTESQVALWQNEGLPADRISIENGAIMTTCTRWPLLIDPQLQGMRWLKKHEENRTSKSNRHVRVMRPGDKQWITNVVQAIQAGDTVIIENVGEVLDSALDPILTKSVHRKGRTLFIKIGEDDVEYDSNFRLYLQTKLSNPHYKPEIVAQCTIINFIVTKRGLEDQLLATIVSEEEPLLEKTRMELVQAFNNYKVQLKELEDSLLERLASAPADILSDVSLIEGLEAIKVKVNETNEAVKLAKISEIGINEAREVYRVVATEASLLYFVMLQLGNVDHMYQYSLDSFTTFFLKALKAADVSSEKVVRVTNLQLTLRWTIFKWVMRGLFEKHRLTFLTLLAINLMQQGWVGEESGFSPAGLNCLLSGPKILETASPLSWLSDTAWGGIKHLTSLDGFEKLASDMEDNSTRFLEWYQHFTPETERLPVDWRELDKTPFKKLLVVRFLRPDRTTAALTNFIRDIFPKGKEYVEFDSQLNSFQILEQAFSDTSPLIPLYFILSPGSDVVLDVDKLASKMEKEKGVDYHNISLGQGQDLIAQDRLEVGQRQGHWVFLNNVHLMPRWLNTLEKKLEEYAVNSPHDDFRIMLSSDPSKNIPIPILERSIKMTSDPPSGLKANLKQAFACFSKDFYEELEPRTKGILFGLCQFHAILIERKKFGPKGYNMMYPFSMGDLTCASAVLKNYMESAPAKVPWTDLRYLFGEIMYGGHIVNDSDRLLANTYLTFFMKDELLDEMNLYPYSEDGMRAPSTTLSYSKVMEHIEDSLKAETPLAFGLHPNAEIGFRTETSEELLRVIFELSTLGDGLSGDSQNTQTVAEQVLQEVLDNIRDTHFDMELIVQSCDDVGPFQNVVLQESERMNALLNEMVRSLEELSLGFQGELTMSDTMEDLAESLFLDRVPKSWEALAYPSLRPLVAWMSNLHRRIGQLLEWSSNPTETPLVTWLSGLFNPQSFLTAVMQSTAQNQTLELDKLTLLTDVTKRMQMEEVTVAAKEGTYITGMSLEGGSWNAHLSYLEQSKPREMYCPLPIINVRPAMVDKIESSLFMCPVYKTQKRGSTYVFSLQLRSKSDPGKWILAGVVSVMDVI